MQYLEQLIKILPPNNNDMQYLEGVGGSTCGGGWGGGSGGGGGGGDCGICITGTSSPPPTSLMDTCLMLSDGTISPITCTKEPFPSEP